MAWTQWLGWTAAYAVLYWAVEFVLALLEERLPVIAQWGRFLIPLLFAFLIAARLRSWWWILGPPVAIILTMLTYPIASFLTSSQPNREQMGTGLIFAVFLVVMNAGLALLAAAAGVLYAKMRFDG